MFLFSFLPSRPQGSRVRFEIKGSSVRPGSSSLYGWIVGRLKVVLLVVFVLQLMVGKLQTVQLKFSTSRSEKSRLTPVPHPHQHLVTITIIAMSVLLMLLSAFFFFSLMSLDTFLRNSLVALHLLLFTITFFASSLPAIIAALALFTKIFASSLSTRGALLKTLAVLDKGLGGGHKGDRLVACKIILIS